MAAGVIPLSVLSESSTARRSDLLRGGARPATQWPPTGPVGQPCRRDPDLRAACRGRFLVSSTVCDARRYRFPGSDRMLGYVCDGEEPRCALAESCHEGGATQSAGRWRNHATSIPIGAPGRDLRPSETVDASGHQLEAWTSRIARESVPGVLANPTSLLICEFGRRVLRPTADVVRQLGRRRAGLRRRML